MLTPRHTRLSRFFWKHYIRFIIYSDFSRFEYSGDTQIDPGRPLLVLANHFSWWDGFFIYHLGDVLLGKRFHVMMLEEQLHNYPILRSAGAFSVNKNSRSILESLAFAASLLHDPANLVLIFPQGRIESIHCENPGFEKGVMKIIEQCPANVQILFSAAFTDYLSDRKPAVHLYLKKFETQDRFTFHDLRSAFEAHYRQAKAQQSSVSSEQ